MSASHSPDRGDRRRRTDAPRVERPLWGNAPDERDDAAGDAGSEATGISSRPTVWAPTPDPSRIEYFAPCTLGVEAGLAAELSTLGAKEISARPGGVSFVGDRRLGYAANLWLRCAIRVQDLLLRAPARGQDALRAAAGAIDWSRQVRVEQALAIDASVRDS